MSALVGAAEPAALGAGSRARSRWTPWQGWGVALITPYLLIFAFFVV